MTSIAFDPAKTTKKPQPRALGAQPALGGNVVDGPGGLVSVQQPGQMQPTPLTGAGDVSAFGTFTGGALDKTPKGTGGFFPVGQPKPPAGNKSGLVAPAPTVANQTSFTNSSNLIGSQFNPTPSAQTQQASGLASGAAQTYAANQPAPFRGISPLDTSGAAGQMAGGAALYNQQQAFGYQPVAGTDQTQTRSLLGQAMPYATGSDAARSQAGAGAVGSFSYGGDTSGVRGQAQSQLNTLLNTTPDRAKLSADAYQLMLERAQPGEQAADRALAQKTAALGRVGSGMFNSNQMDLATQRELTRDQARRELSMDAAQQSLADQQAKLSAAQGLAGDMSSWDLGAGGLNADYNQMALGERNASFNRLQGLDQNAFRNLSDMAGFEYGMARDTRGDQVDERGAQRTAQLDANDVFRSRGDATRQLGLDQYGLQSDADARNRDERGAEQNYDQMAFDRSRAQFGDLADWQGQREGEDRANRGEMRGERDYQYGLSRDAQGDAINQWLMQQDAQNNDWNQAMQAAQFGYGTNPANAYLNAGQQQGQQAGAATGAAADLLTQYGQRRGRKGSQQPAQYPQDPPPAMGY